MNRIRHWLYITSVMFFLVPGCGTKPPAPEQDLEQKISTSLPGSEVISPGTAGDAVLLNTLSGHSMIILDLEFSPRGDYLVSSSRDRNIKLWDLESWQEETNIRMTSVDMADIEISHDGNLLATGEAIWDLNSMEEIHLLERGSIHPASVSFSPDDTVLALGLMERGISIWDVASGEIRTTFPLQEENRTKSMDFSPDGELLAVGVINGSIRLLNADSGEIIRIIQSPGETDIHDLAFSPDGKYFASGGRLPAVFVWDVEGNEIIHRLRLTDNMISLAFSPDGSLLASTGGYENAVLLWDLESGELLNTLRHDDQLMAVAFSADGKLLAAGCYDSRIYIWGIPQE